MQVTGKHKASIFVISGPSGAGKSTVCKKIVEKKLEKLVLSISYTTRKKRESETNGKEYCFVSLDEFNDMISKNKFVEFADVHGNFYGTSKEILNEKLGKNIDVILEIDVIGARKIKEHYNDAVFIFITAPSREELINRIKGRNSEDEEMLKKRLKTAESEMNMINMYDYVVENDIIYDTVKRVIGIIKKERT